MKQRKNKNIVIGTLCALIIGMAVGYAALSQILKINGTSKIVGDFNIQFTKIDENTMVNATTVSKGGVGTTTATFTVDLEKPGSSAIYDLTVENKGSIDAILKSIEGLDESNLSEPLDIKFSLIGIEEGDPLNVGASKSFQVRVVWDSNATNIPSNNKTLILKLNYEQKGGTSGGTDPVLPEITGASKYLIDNVVRTDNISPTNGLYANDENGEITISDSPRDYRYIGANPNNYVKFGTYTQDVYLYHLEGNLEGEVMNDDFKSLEDCQQTLMFFPNPEESVTVNCEPKKIHSKGDPISWRIIGIFGGQLKLIAEDYINRIPWNRTETQMFDAPADWSQASLKNYLNNDYLNILDSASQQKIYNYTWKLGAIDLNYDYASHKYLNTTKNIYEQERGTSRYNETFPLEWTGKAALMYPSDFGFATSGGGTVNRSSCLSTPLYAWYKDLGSDCFTNNWLFDSSKVQWTLTPNYESGTSFDDMVMVIPNTVDGGNGQGFGETSVSGNLSFARPTVYLNYEVDIVYGTGTEQDPYILK